MVLEYTRVAVFLCCVREMLILWIQCFRISVSLSFVSTVVPYNSPSDSEENSLLLRYGHLC